MTALVGICDSQAVFATVFNSRSEAETFKAEIKDTTVGVIWDRLDLVQVDTANDTEIFIQEELAFLAKEE